ncbi:Foldase protein PrsA 2 precursor [Thalassoglobus neptunius]|uniref:peptidylprolyl isomerase n=1 Tax=Thalassoglobus neptunius TaxID=1938619 RepID=A0A5C5X4R2_9PLAN|nr:peptidylprolyl isomerase [Thalassoglobus neptunius]TWT57996.1 Foldase protein PrsA 2 precursor [Thalassoglobus neptunius]
MSERNHSPENSALPAQSSRTKKQHWLTYVIGTVVLVAVAAVGFQFILPSPAASQTTNDASGQVQLQQNSTRVLAKVNNQAISYDVVAQECVSRHGEDVLDTLINRLVIQQACQAAGVTVTAAEVQEEVAANAKKFNLPLDTWYQMLQAERGLTKEQYHDDVIWPMIALKKLAGQDVDVTEQDMQDGFERDYGPRVKARMIVVDGSIRQANQIWEKCKATPDDFDRLAMEYSSDPNSRPLGGSIPPIRKHGVEKVVEEAAFKLQPGEISGVIQVAQSRYVILKCEGHTEPVVTDIREVWNDLFKQLKEEKTQIAVAKVFEKIKKDARVDNFLTRTTTGPRPTQPIRQVSGSAPAGAGR